MAQKYFQFINWFPDWQGFHYKRLSINTTDLAYIYEWMIWIGYFEIRKWRSNDGK